MTKGFYAGGTAGLPQFGLGAGLYFDDHNNFYPQVYYGAPGLGVAAGYSPDIEGLLTGPSVSGSFGRRSVRYNTGTSGGSAGFGIGTPGVGVTYGFGPYKVDPAPLDAIGEINPAIYSTGFDLPSDRHEAFSDRFEKWPSSPLGVVPQVAPDSRDSFDNRFGNWGSVSTGDLDNSRSPVLRALEQYRRKGAAVGPPTVAPPQSTAGTPTSTSSNLLVDEAQGGVETKPERYLSRRVVNRSPVSQLDVAPSIVPGGPKTFADRFGNWTASPDGGISPRNPNLPEPPPEAGRPLGIVSGQPMQLWITPPPIFGQRDRSKAPVDEGKELLMRMIRSVVDY